MNEKTLIGRAERAWLVDFKRKDIPARIDTGARTSSLWASDITETDAGVNFVLFGKDSPLYTGEVHTAPKFEKIAVASSTGHVQERYKIPLLLQMRGRRIRTFCTLADRSTQAFPLLIGRNTLRGKFVVDVQKGSRKLDDIDKERYNQLQSLLKERGL